MKLAQDPKRVASTVQTESRLAHRPKHAFDTLEQALAFATRLATRYKGTAHVHIDRVGPWTIVKLIRQPVTRSI